MDQVHNHTLMAALAVQGVLVMLADLAVAVMDGLSVVAAAAAADTPVAVTVALILIQVVAAVVPSIQEPTRWLVSETRVMDWLLYLLEQAP